MAIYLIVFAISIFASKMAHAAADKKNKILLVIYSLIAVLLPSTLAGIRDSGVGYDTEVYGNITFEWLSAYSYLDVKSFIILLLKGEFGSEWLYMTWIYCSIKLTGDIHWYYFSINLFTCLFTYLAIFVHRKRASMALMMFVFLFSFYNISLNAMRQCMALALVLFSYKYFEERNWIIHVPLLILSTWCHNSAVFYIFVLFLIWLQQQNKISERFFTYLIIFIPVSFLFLDPILNFLVDVGIFPAKYDNLYNTENSHGGLMAANTLLSLTLYGILKFGNVKCRLDEYYENNICINNQLLYFVFMLSMIVSIWAFRISYYFYYMNILFLPIYIQNIKNIGGKNYLVTKYMIIGMVLFIWFWTIIINNENATYPYESEILKLMISL